MASPMIRSDSPADVGLGVVEEVDPGVVGGGQAVLGQAAGQLGPEGDPRAEGQHADLEPGPAQSPVLHRHADSSWSGSDRSYGPSLSRCPVEAGPRRVNGQMAGPATVTSVPIGVSGQTWAASAMGISTHPLLWGDP